MPLRAPRGAHSPIPFLAAASLVLVAGCLGPLDVKPTPVAGSGNVATEDRTAGEFTALSAGAGLNLVIATGATTEVTLTAQANLLPYVRTTVTAGQLVVTVEAPGISSTRPVTLKVTTPTLVSVSLGEGSTGTMEVQSEVMEINLSGGADLKAIGSVGQLALTAGGGAKAELGDLAVVSCTVTMSGGSQATLRVSTTLTGTADSGATINLAVKPATQTVRTSGGAIVVGG